MANIPGYAATPHAAGVAISTANTNRDGTGTIGTIFTAGASGSRIDTVVIQATGTTTAGMVRLYLHNGTTAFLIGEVPVLAVTPSGTVPAWRATLNQNTCDWLPMAFGTGYSLRASTHNAETFNIVPTFSGDL